MNLEEIISNANITKEVLMDALVIFGEIDKEKAEKIKEEYAVIVHKRGMLGKVIDRLKGHSDTDYRIQIVKLPIIRNEENEKNT